MKQEIKSFIEIHEKIESIKHIDNDCKFSFNHDCEKCCLIKEYGQRDQAKKQFIFEVIENIKKSRSEIHLDNQFMTEKDIEESKQQLEDSAKSMVAKQNTLLTFAKTFGSEKTKAIIQTIESNSNNKYFTITDKMIYCIKSDIFSRFELNEIVEIFRK